MWELISTKNPEERLVFLVGEKYCVGRLEGDISIPADKSISRKHAYLQVTHPETNIGHPYKPASLMVQDVSKFGTVVKDEVLKGNQAIVKSGDTIKFGTVDSIYRAILKPFIVTTSCLDTPAKKSTKSLVGRLGGHVVNEWRKDQCQILIMTSLSVTVKVICALISQCPIVTPEYLEQKVAAIKNRTTLPDPKNFLPPLAESQLDPTQVDFRANPVRSTLFQGKIFIFLSTKQFKKLNVAVDLAGGVPMLMEEGTEDDDHSMLIKEDTCVMQCDPTDNSQSLSQNAKDWINHVIDLLKTNKKRLIPDSEVGYAILYCSTDRYCNPNLESDSSQPRHVTTQSLEPLHPADVTTVPETNISRRISDITTIPETEISLNSSRRRSEARGHPDAEVKDEPVNDETNSAQTETNNNQIVKSKKRGRSEDEETENVLPFSKSQKRDSAATSSEIKEEPITPRPSRRSRAQKSPSPSRTKVAESPSPPPVNRRGRRNRKSSSDIGDFDVKDEDGNLFDEFDMPSTRRRRGRAAKSRSPSPAPTRSSPRSKRGRRRDSAASEDSKSPASKRSGSPTSTKSRSPSSRSPSPKPTRRGKAKAEATTSRQTRSRSSSPSPKPELKEEPKSPSAAPRRGQRTETAAPQPSTSEWKTRSKPKLEYSESDVFSVTLNGEDPAVQALYNRETKKEPLVLTQQKKTATPSPEDFLSKAKHHRVGISDFGVKDESLPTSKLVIKEQSLVVSKPSTKPRAQQNTGDTCMWNGKPCKNFKKFRKNQHAGATALPRIIGSSDLTVNPKHRSEEMDNWFKEMAEEASQRSQVDQMAKDMFEYEPKTNKKRRK